MEESQESDIVTRVRQGSCDVKREREVTSRPWRDDKNAVGKGASQKKGE